MKPCSRGWIVFVGGLLALSRCVSAIVCDVSLPQTSNGFCAAIRNADLAQDKKTFTLKFNKSLHGFALLNMTIFELIEVAKKDPFIRGYTTEYVQMSQAYDKIFQQYIGSTHAQEIQDISQYLPLAHFFQHAPEPTLGKIVRLPSQYEEFIDNKSEWISDRYFTQQRLAGINPKSLKRVSFHGEAERKCTVKTTDGRWCHFPFTSHGKTYYSCTKTGYHRHKPWCSTTETYKGKWGECAEKKSDKDEDDLLESKDCSVKTTEGEWCHFPFVFGGRTYESCRKGGNGRLWCATTPNFSESRRWGYCAEKQDEDKYTGPVGLDWNKLKKILNPTFDWSTAVQDALGSTYQSLDHAIREKRIYALRYEECDGLPRSEDLTDFDPRRTMWDFLSPIALFASKLVGEENELVPVAIQMHYTPESAVFTPKDGDNWHIAKLNVQITDLGYVQIVEHLAKVHYFAEPFCICLKRTLPDLHPLNQILKYHCREVIIPNTLGTPALVAEKRAMDLLFAYGNVGALRLIQAAHLSATWEVTNFRRDMKKRGLENKKVLPYFPYRDDGERILRVIEDFVEKYVDMYYDDDWDVRDDVELQAYVNEVSLDGTGKNGGIGRIQGFPASVHSKSELCDIVSRIICHMSIHHAAVNYGLADYTEYIPNQPTKLYNDTRVSTGSFSVYRLPNRLTSALGADLSNRLARLRFDSLFDYGNELQDIKAVNLVNRFYSYLMNVVQPQLQEENRKRKERAQLTYPNLIPRWLPNGIQS